MNNSSASVLSQQNTLLTPYDPSSSQDGSKTLVRIPTDSYFLNELNGTAFTSSSSQGTSLLIPGSNNNNRYYQLVANLTPNEMLQKFSSNAPRNVQEAVKSTIMSLLGNLPSYALDAALITTNTKLANLMFQMQITGYMFKNGEYRMSWTKSLKTDPFLVVLKCEKEIVGSQSHV